MRFKSYWIRDRFHLMVCPFLFRSDARARRAQGQFDSSCHGSGAPRRAPRRVVTRTPVPGGICFRSPSASPHQATSPAAVSSAKQSTRFIPFHGMISAVDQTAKTFAIAGKKRSPVFKVTDKTTITKAGNTASMQDITENEEASGSYWKNADGTLEAKTVRLGPVGKTKTSTASPVASPKTSPSPKP